MCDYIQLLSVMVIGSVLAIVMVNVWCRWSVIADSRWMDTMIDVCREESYAIWCAMQAPRGVIDGECAVDAERAINSMQTMVKGVYVTLSTMHTPPHLITMAEVQYNLMVAEVKPLTKKQVMLDLAKELAEKKYGTITPCTGHTWEECLVYELGRTLFYFNDETHSTRAIRM